MILLNKDNSIIYVRYIKIELRRVIIVKYLSIHHTSVSVVAIYIYGGLEISLVRETLLSHPI